MIIIVGKSLLRAARGDLPRFDSSIPRPGWRSSASVFGPVFHREVLTAPRRVRHYLYRSLYVVALLVLLGTAWLVLSGTQPIRNVGDLSRFGGTAFQFLAPLQLAVLTFLGALGAAAAVSQEKDRRTILLLLLTRMTNFELVVGKLAASLLNVASMLVVSFPVFLLVTVFGGVSIRQVVIAYAITAASVLGAASVGCTVAFWRDKTFQALAITVLAIVLWIAFWEVVAVIASGSGPAWDWAERVAAAGSPIRAIGSVVIPDVRAPRGGQMPAWNYVGTTLAVALVLTSVAVWRVRVWNPSRQVRRRGSEDEKEGSSIWGVEHDLAEAADQAEAARQTHVDARTGSHAARRSRRVWDHPVLWREVCTWAYGRKVLLIRAAYLLLWGLVLWGLRETVGVEVFDVGRDQLAGMVPASAQLLAPFLLISLVIINALGVTSITNERDELALDLLLATDITPKEFVFGKLLGVLYVTKEMVLGPLLLIAALWFFGGITLENSLYVVVGILVMDVFAAMLGIHYGMTYSSSRTAILVSLGTVFFLFVGVVTCLVIMVSFRSSFQNQLAPFLAFILGGGVGLYVALGYRNPSPAIAASSLVLPFATFFAITGFLVGNQELTVFVVITASYGFTIAAMLVPAVSAFDIAMGRTRGGEEAEAGT